MPVYQLELKQLVDYPRRRIYREFIRTLMNDRTLHSRGGSGLFYFMILCSLANFRSSYRRLEGTSYTIYPGGICRLSEITGWFRMRCQCQAIEMLDCLQQQHYITYRGTLAADWSSLKYATGKNPIRYWSTMPHVRKIPDFSFFQLLKPMS